MKAEVVNPFLSATALVFRDVLGTQLVRGRTQLRDRPSPGMEIAVFIELKGPAAGLVVYSLNLESALKITRRLLPGKDRDVLLEEYRDVMGELANMITGNAIQAFMKSGQVLDLGVPVVFDVRTRETRVAAMPTLRLNLYSRYGLLETNIALGSEAAS